MGTNLMETHARPNPLSHRLNGRVVDGELVSRAAASASGRSPKAPRPSERSSQRRRKRLSRFRRFPEVLAVSVALDDGKGLSSRTSRAFNLMVGPHDRTKRWCDGADLQKFLGTCGMELSEDHAVRRRRKGALIVLLH